MTRGRVESVESHVVCSVCGGLTVQRQHLTATTTRDKIC